VTKDPKIFLGHILESIDRIREYTEGLDEDSFAEDDKVQDAVLRRIQIIGEAVKKLPEELRAAHPQVPWRRIAGTRDKVVHDYFGIDIELVWIVAESQLPELAVEIRSILGSL
jgi:uncharacterized protein with HEPN domain